MGINFNLDDATTELAVKIEKRAQKMHPLEWPSPQVVMTLAACHNHGCPLDLAKLLAFDDFNFDHDIYGIGSHICHETGKLRNNFLPRCAAQKPYGWLVEVAYLSSSRKQNDFYRFTGSEKRARLKASLKTNFYRIASITPLTKEEYGKGAK